MNYKNYLDNIATQFKNIIHEKGTPLEFPTEDFGWENWRCSLEGYFRYAHIERYSDGKIEVLHITTYPFVTCGEPIFGFDVICIESRVVGIYMDFSPILIDYGNFTEDLTIESNRDRPEWATVFSDNFIRFTPSNDDEFTYFCEWVIKKYEWYLNRLNNRMFINEPSIVNSVIQKQNHYSVIQQTNPRTYNVLKKKLGHHKAQYFMTQVLFPEYGRQL